MSHYYTVFNDRDEVIAFGDAATCTKALGLKDTRQFYAFVSKTKSGLRKYNSVVVDSEKEVE